MAVTRYAVSPDGTRLGVQLVGTGPHVLFVHGGTADRTRWDRLAEPLRGVLTMCLLDRRGRGLSRDESAGPYTWKREAADVAAVAEAVGARAVVAHSYGGLCALGATQLTSAIDRVVVYEPTIAAPGVPIIPAGVLERIGALLAGGRADDALSLFFIDVVGVPPDDVAQRRQTSDWHARLAALPTALREGAAVAAVDVDALALEEIGLPVAVLVGSTTTAPLAAAARAVAARLPQGRLIELAGSGHTAMDDDPSVFASVLLDALGVAKV